MNPHEGTPLAYEPSKMFPQVTMEDYRPLVGDEATDRLLTKAEPLRDLHVVNVNSTYYGGGVSELLGSMTLLMDSLGLDVGWRVILGSPDYFGVTKSFHNGLQGAEIDLPKRNKEIYEGVVYQNSLRNHLDHDVVIVHDPQPLPLIEHYRKTVPWIWRMHIDMSSPNKELWNYLKPWVDQYDAMIISHDDYRQKDTSTPQYIFPPAIDPLNIKNREMSEDEVDARLARYDIPTDLPIVTQISRFDKWKDPKGVVDAFKIARKEVDATLVLLGNVATDDPEGMEVFESISDQQEERIIMLTVEDTALVNALQRRSAVVLQKSLREGFGLTVSEAMWKGTPVIGGNVGGIRVQIDDGENGYLVNSVEEAAQRIVQLLKNPAEAEKMGAAAREKVRHKYLLNRYVENYIDLISSFETQININKGRYSEMVNWEPDRKPTRPNIGTQSEKD